ncbi:MAG: tRNA (adenosine(37)-N6)-dimethylallyltransferase MiaA [Trueperaceae bacterium]|nr:MAG: tRNA (adenosine(37)-N6)-dimethylallyltransferase MiaA [Trueperaceae bacterium]
MLVPVLGAPTASGKSSIALELAERYDLEIVSADAMQVYRGMDIGTAKPTPAERHKVPHHLIDLVTPAEAFSVADFVREAERVIGEVLGRGTLPLVVGGTGFYIRALTEGLPAAPPADPAEQAELWQVFEHDGLEPLLQELERASPEDAHRAQRNPRRVVRALEVLRRTGKPPSAFGLRPPTYRFDKVVLLPTLEVLAPRITSRTETMFARGLVGEVEGLLQRYPKQLTASQAIGYKEVVAYLQGQSSLEETKTAVTLATRQYARRQRTWFAKEPHARRYPRLALEIEEELLAWLAGLAQQL